MLRTRLVGEPYTDAFCEKVRPFHGPIINEFFEEKAETLIGKEFN